MAFYTLLEATAEAIVESIQLQLSIINLKDSNLYKNITYKIDSKSLSLTIIMPDYFKYIESGRKAFARKVPIIVLLKWLKRKNIQPKQSGMKLNALAFAIQNSIYKKGIKPRKFLQKALDVADIRNELTIEINTLLTSEIKKFFK